MDRSDLPALQAFVVIARSGSLRAAARVLGVNPPAVSHQLKTFEERLGTALFLRSTRSVTLTDAGKALYESSSHLLETLDEALGVARNATKARSGRLRITLPFRAWQVILAPTIAAFRQAYPDIVLDLTIDEALADVVSRGFHAGIRLGDYLQDGMIAVRLSPFEEAAYVAAPDYLKRHGVPSQPRDLLHHHCIRHRQVTSGRLSEWRFNGPEGDIVVDVNGALIMDDMRAVLDATRLGLGIGWSLRRGVQEDLDNGRLQQVLSQFTPSRPGFFVYFPKSLQHFGPLRAFIEHFRPA
jgi:DNA-binding transcriptional LysR family regulator